MDARIGAKQQREGRRTSQRLKKASTHLKSAPGKENVCPSDSIVPLGQRRSPLPEEFPRVPLQDITFVLSPLNMQPEEEMQGQTAMGKFGQRRKKTRKEILTANKLSQLQGSVTRWEGPKHCSTVEVTNKDTQILNEAQSAETQKEQKLVSTQAGASETEVNCNMGLVSKPEEDCLQIVRNQKRQRQSKNTRLPESKCRSSVLKIR